MSNQIEFRHLRYFQVVAEELHFRKASERLFITQPGLSRQIKQLEEELGVRLFIRSKRQVELTEAGKYLYDESSNLLSQLEAVKRSIRLIDKGEEGELNIGFVGSAMQQAIPDLLLKLKNQFPKIHTSLHEMSNKDQLFAIAHNQLDIGFIRAKDAPEGIACRQIFKDNFSLVLPKNHPANQASFTDLSNFAQENFILFSSDYSRTYYNKVMSIFDDHGFSPKISHRSVHANTIFRLVENGLGIAIVPTSLKDGFDLDIKFIELTNVKQTTYLSLIWKEGKENRLIKKFVSLLLVSD